MVLRFIDNAVREKEKFIRSLVVVEEWSIFFAIVKFLFGYTNEQWRQGEPGWLFDIGDYTTQ